MVWFKIRLFGSRELCLPHVLGKDPNRGHYNTSGEPNIAARRSQRHAALVPTAQKRPNSCLSLTFRCRHSTMTGPMILFKADRSTTTEDW